MSLTLYCSAMPSARSSTADAASFCRRHLLGQLVAPVDLDDVDGDQLGVDRLGQLAAEVDDELIGRAAVEAQHGLSEGHALAVSGMRGEGYHRSRHAQSGAAAAASGRLARPSSSSSSRR